MKNRKIELFFNHGSSLTVMMELESRSDDERALRKIMKLIISKQPDIIKDINGNQIVVDFSKVNYARFVKQTHR
ncbi:hypothetical protein ACQV2R_03390 [Facklamia sp. P12937]|uniref:hypothetical protein n=2 Tax=Facklamia TaxID=66831 RepID=UPI003D1708F2